MKTLATLMIALAAATAAQSAEIPAKYRGEWCADGGPPYYQPKAANPCQRIRITAKTFEADGGERCRIASVAKMKMLAPGNQQPVDYVLKFKCNVPPPWFQGSSLDADKLVYTFWVALMHNRTNQLYFEKVAVKEDSE
jgi:hypothetical protein